ncbi:MAG TPA: hypothetical protein VMW10_08660, partial [Alphaproteobacteria bacterium]|nr:hypothetical protein [Alphaproteobacteria bacterium]
AQEAFGVSREKASHMLWRLSKQGWIKKLKTGLYRVVPLESSDPSFTDENPWIIANELYAPCYIGGWTAANFWGLTDQLFLKTWVMTTRPVHKKTQSVSQHEYVLSQVKDESFFGLKIEWIENNKVLLSDPHKTLLDFLSFPDDYTAQTMVDITQSYLRSELKDIHLLDQYTQKIANKSVLKRLGFLLELLAPDEKSLIEFCYKNISKGYSSLSTQSPCTKAISRWNLRVPARLKDYKIDD